MVLRRVEVLEVIGFNQVVTGNLTALANETFLDPSHGYIQVLPWDQFPSFAECKGGDVWGDQLKNLFFCQNRLLFV